MNLLIFNSIQEASAHAFHMIADALKNGATTFGLATGGTPETLYKLIRESDLDFTQATSINLDEYYGLAYDHPKSYHYYMREHLFNAKPFKNNYLPNGLNTNVEEETAAYEAIIAQNPIDLQILGIGSNGHIGFNEPGTSFDSTTSLVNLTDSTIQANKRYFESEADVPKQAYSMGIHTIMQAKKIILLAFGESKAEAIQHLISGQVTTDNPSSILNTHPDVTVIVDKEAASLLKDKTEV